MHQVVKRWVINELTQIEDKLRTAIKNLNLNYLVHENYARNQTYIGVIISTSSEIEYERLLQNQKELEALLQNYSSPFFGNVYGIFALANQQSISKRLKSSLLRRLILVMHNWDPYKIAGIYEPYKLNGRVNHFQLAKENVFTALGNSHKELRIFCHRLFSLKSFEKFVDEYADEQPLCMKEYMAAPRIILEFQNGAGFLFQILPQKHALHSKLEQVFLPIKSVFREDFTTFFGEESSWFFASPLESVKIPQNLHLQKAFLVPRYKVKFEALLEVNRIMLDE
jgi:hypothetical protein